MYTQVKHRLHYLTAIETTEGVGRHEKQRTACSCWPELCCFILCKEDSTGMQYFCRNDLGANVHTCCSEPASLGIIYFTPHPTPIRGWRLSVIPRVCLIFSGFAYFGWHNGRGNERTWEKAKKEPKKDAWRTAVHTCECMYLTLRQSALLSNS